jgi:hypothetical protein
MALIFRVFKATTDRSKVPPDDIAVACAIAVMQQIRSEIVAMGPAELRGYVRAIALPIVRAHLQATRGKVSQRTAHESELIAVAAERTVQLVLRDLQMPPVVDVPAPHVAQRAAA